MKLDDLVRHRTRMMKVLADTLDEKRLADLWRMSRFTTQPDGFKTRTLSDGTPGGSSEDTATERAALAGLPDGTPWSAWSVEQGCAPPVGGDNWDDERRWQADPLGDAIADVLADLILASEKLVHAERKMQYITAAADGARGRQSSLQADCLCCNRSVSGSSKDRLRGGLCPACDTAYRRARNAGEVEFDADGMLDRQGWIEVRRTWMKSSADVEPVVHAVELDPVMRRALSRVTGGFKRGVGEVSAADVLPPIQPAVLPDPVSS